MPTTSTPNDVASSLRAGAQAVGAREGALLLAYVLGMRRQDLYTQERNTPVPQPALRRYHRLLRARRRGLPLAYLIGSASFWDMELEVGPDVLVPRPETEHLVEGVAEAARDMKAPVIVDIGTGSGAIAIALSRTLPHAVVYASDRSPAALRTAERNAARWAPTLRCLPAGDLLEPLARAGVSADVVVSNPPYIRSRDMQRLPRDVQREPRLALDGGPDGFHVIRRLVRAVSRGQGVRPGCQVWLEVGAGQAAQASEILAALGGPTLLRKDLAGIDRVVTGSWQP